MWTTVAGNNDRGEVIVYALSTCPWCRRTKRLLQDNGVPFRFVDVDLVSADEEDVVVAEISRLNPMQSFPTIVINGQVVAGFQEGRIRELLSL
jgi:glutaredoxin